MTGNHPSARDVTAAMTSSHRLAGILAMALVVAACGPGAASSPTPSIEPTPGASPTPVVGDIDHPTGATTVILRLDEGGGFVPPGWMVTEAPPFTLYGDGTAIFRDPSAQPPAAVGGVIRSVPYQAVRLSEDEIQALLAFALGPGALGIAREQYILPVADAPTTTFTIVAGGLDRTVSVNGLGIGADAGADAAVLNALANLRARLYAFGTQVGGETPWIPERYRGVLLEPFGGAPGGNVIPWPWPTIEPSDFTAPADPNLPSWPSRVMSPDEIAALGIDGLEGGAQGFWLSGPDGESGVPAYEFALRPLLPDEPR